MNRVAAIAANTFREAVRDRVLYNLIVFALLLMATAILFGQISIGIETVVLVNLGLTAMTFFGLAIAIFIGIGLVSKEIDKRTLYALFAHPVRRAEFIAGKFLGLALTLFVNLALMTLGFLATYFYVQWTWDWASVPPLLIAIYFIFLQLVLATALALLFSCFSSPLLSAVFTLGLFIVGSFAADMRQLGEAMKVPWLETVTTVVYYLVPHFDNFNVISQAAYGQSVPAYLVTYNTAYAAVYTLLVVSAGGLIFHNRDL